MKFVVILLILSVMTVQGDLFSNITDTQLAPGASFHVRDT